VLLRFGAARGVQDFEIEAVLLHDPGALPAFRDGGIPEASVGSRDLHIFGPGRGARRQPYRRD